MEQTATLARKPPKTRVIYTQGVTIWDDIFDEHLAPNLRLHSNTQFVNGYLDDKDYQATVSAEHYSTKNDDQQYAYVRCYAELYSFDTYEQFEAWFKAYARKLRERIKKENNNQ